MTALMLKLALRVDAPRMGGVKHVTSETVCLHMARAQLVKLKTNRWASGA